MRIGMAASILLALSVVPALAADPPALHFAGPPAAADVKITLKDAAFRHELVIENASKDPMPDVTVEVNTSIPGFDCKLDDGKARCDTAFAVAAFRSRAITLTATIPEPATWVAVVSVVSKTSRHSVVLSITRSEPPFPLKLVGGAKSAEQTTGGLLIGVMVQDTSGKGATLHAPTVFLTRKAPNGRGQLEAAFGSAFHNDDRDRTDLGGTWAVPKNGSKKLLVDIRDLDEPGEYSGFVHLTSPDVSASLDVPLRIWIKQGAGCAGALIAFGVGLSFLLRVLVRSVRPALVQYRDAARLTGDVRRIRAEIEKRFGSIEEREKSLLDDYEARLVKLAELFETGESTSAGADLQEIDGKLSMTVRWVNARRRLATLPDATRAELAPKLENVTAFLESRTADGADAAKKTLGELDEAIEKAARAESEKNVAFRAQLEAAKAKPVGFTEEQWTTLRNATLAALDAAAQESESAQRVKKYNAAFLAYTREVVQRLRDYANSQLDRIEKDPNIDATKKTDLKTRINAIIASLNTAETDAGAGRIREAAIAATTAGEILLKAMQEVPGLLVAKVTDAAPATAPAPVEAAFGDTFVGLILRRLRLDGGTATVTRYLLTIDVLVALAALAIAVLLGLTLLWAPDVDWGSPQDYIVAVLWGLGLHQIGNSTFSGISGLVEKFK